MSPRRAVEIVEQIATADGSAAWAAAIGFGTNLFAGYLPYDGAAEVFADPDQSNAAVFAALARGHRAGDGSLRLTGRWPFTSNCEQAGWIGLAARFPDELAPRLVFVPRSEVTIHPTWDVVGLRATASNDTSVADIEVDRRHTCSFVDRPWPDGAAMAPATVRRARPNIGRGVARRRPRRPRRGEPAGGQSTEPDAWLAARRPVGMGDLAACRRRCCCGARAGLLAAADECWARAEADEPSTGALQARAFLAAQHCTDVAVEVCATAHRLGGGAAAYRTSPLLRALRDVQTVRQHAMFSHGLRPHLARTIAGTDEALPPFVI